jgi:proteic killer suppression protein
MAIRSFGDKISEEICYGVNSRQTRKRLPLELHQKAQIKLARLAAATSLNDLTDLRGNRLEVLKGNRVGQFSIRINDQFRICFRWVNNDAFDVEVTDYH